METVHQEAREDGILLLTLDKPPANAIDETLLAGLDAAIEAETEDEALQTMLVWMTPESRAARAEQRRRLGVRG